ncbi:MAG TPA: hypothetical protein VGN32_20565 [Ktedonobacterales bacterium]|nr:hypothetical protein [Ktedonobacterales bacterium]
MDAQVSDQRPARHSTSSGQHGKSRLAWLARAVSVTAPWLSA